MAVYTCEIVAQRVYSERNRVLYPQNRIGVGI